MDPIDWTGTWTPRMARAEVALRGALPTPEATGAEALLHALVLWLQLAVEAAGAAVVLAGFLATLAIFVRHAAGRGPILYVRIRLVLARHLALALEFQLAADVLATAVAPSWPQIGQLAAIAAIRTLLNVFLEREMRAERAELEGAGRESAPP